MNSVCSVKYITVSEDEKLAYKMNTVVRRFPMIKKIKIE
jgi:hypothetical protein